MILKLLKTLVITTLLLGHSFVFAQSDDFSPYEWDLTELYPSLEAWEAERQRLLSDIDGIEAFRGTLGDNSESLHAALSYLSDTYKELLRVYSYASMEQDQDLRVTQSQERNQLGEGLFARYSQAKAFVDPELVAIGEERINAFIQDNSDLAPFTFMLEDTLRQSQHTLSD